MELAVLGAGAMGRWFAKFAGDRGWEVSITDIDGRKARRVSEELNINLSDSNEAAARDAGVVLVAVPIKETPQVIEEVAGSVAEDSLLVDIASVKEGPVTKMEEIDVDCELASIHPLFGPGTESLEDQNIISIPVKVGERYQRFKDILSSSGAQIKEMKAEEHDRLMSVVQSLTHLTLLIYVSAFNSMKSSGEALSFQTPMFKKLIDVTKAFLNEDPKLCGDIQTENRYSSMARSSILEACRSLNVALKAENTRVIEDIFEEAREELGMNEIEKAYEEMYEEGGG